MTNQETFAHFLRSVEAMKEEGQAEASLVRGYNAPSPSY
jgi:hypothetical protein